MPRGIVPERAVQTPRAKHAAAPGVYILFRGFSVCDVWVGATRSDPTSVRFDVELERLEVKLQLCESCVTVIMSLNPGQDTREQTVIMTFTNSAYSNETWVFLCPNQSEVEILGNQPTSTARIN